MIHVIRTNDPGVRKVLARDAFKGKNLIGRGTYSLVYDAGARSVLKLTIDEPTYNMLRNAKHRHFPRIRLDYGVVGSIAMNQGEFPLFLVKMERLLKLPNGSKAKRLATALSRKVLDATVRHRFCWRLILGDIVGDKAVPQSIRGAVKELAGYCESQLHFQLDMHVGNFMARANGELVIVDPLMDRRVWDNRLEDERRRFGNSQSPQGLSVAT